MAINIYADVGERIKKAVEGALTDALNEALPPRGTPISQRQAAAKYGVSPGAIRAWVRKGWVTVLQPSSGNGHKKLVDEYDVAQIVLTNDISKGHRTQAPNGHSLLQTAKDLLNRGDLPSKGIPITVHKAALKYGVSRQTIYDWARKGRIATIDDGEEKRGRRVLVDERDVAVVVNSEGVGLARSINPEEMDSS